MFKAAKVLQAFLKAPCSRIDYWGITLIDLVEDSLIKVFDAKRLVGSISSFRERGSFTFLYVK